MFSKELSERVERSLIVIDKHPGPTSHQVSGWLRDILGLKKVGHTGTLDPMVTGVLPTLLGNAVKMMPMLAGSQKEYVGVMHLHAEVPEEKIREVAKNFIGKITQRPPKKSAVARHDREREIFTFDVTEIDGKDVLFRTRTEAGTYIRKLCHDMGVQIGCGAHMAELRRTLAGGFGERDAHSLVEVKDAVEFAKSGDESRLENILVPIERAIPGSKKIFASDSAIESILNGAPLYVSGVKKVGGKIVRGETVAIVSENGEIAAIGIAKMDDSEMGKKKKGTAVRTDRLISRIKP